MPKIKLALDAMNYFKKTGKNFCYFKDIKTTKSESYIDFELRSDGGIYKHLINNKKNTLTNAVYNKDGILEEISRETPRGDLDIYFNGTSKRTVVNTNEGRYISETIAPGLGIDKPEYHYEDLLTKDPKILLDYNKGKALFDKLKNFVLGNEQNLNPRLDF